MTIAFYDTLISIGVDDVKAKAAAISVCEAIDAKYDIDPYQRLTYNDLQLRCSDLEMYLNEFKFDFIKWILTAALVSIIVCVALCKWIF